jgi:hypothetical protein
VQALDQYQFSHLVSVGAAQEANGLDPSASATADTFVSPSADDICKSLPRMEHRAQQELTGSGDTENMKRLRSPTSARPPDTFGRHGSGSTRRLWRVQQAGAVERYSYATADGKCAPIDGIEAGIQPQVRGGLLDSAEQVDSFEQVAGEEHAHEVRENIVQCG